MKNNRLAINALFLFTLLAAPISFSLCAIVGEPEIFGVAGIVRYSWIMLLFIPVCPVSALVGRRLKKSGRKYKKLYVATWICLPLLLIFGSFRFIFADISYDVNEICAIEEKIAIDFPDRIKVVSHDYPGYNISYVKITDTDEASAFVKQISADPRWTPQLSTIIKGILPFDIQVEMNNFDFFVFYDLFTGGYNESPTAGQCNCVFVAYDCELQRVIILNEYLAKVVTP